MTRKPSSRPIVRSRRTKVHFVGIGGIGMSGLARYFKAKGFEVTGSDLRASDLTRALRREGMRVAIGHRAANVPKDADLVIYNRAIPLDNPELAAARARRISLLPYADALGRLTKMHSTVAITGSHGKTTTTALAALMFMRAGLDPTVFIGTNLRELRGKNMRIGKSPWLVLEADDFGGAFLAYSPAIAIVTNIDREHLDFYGGFANLQKSFVEFLAETHEYGAIILNRDDRVLYGLRARIASVARKKHLRVTWYSRRDPAAKRIKRALKIPGEHNLSNALAVHALGRLIQIPEKKMFAALGAYRGASRRMEYRGIFRGAPVYDDYAHHPTEIKATLAAFREKFPEKKIVCVFEPHQAKRLKNLFKEFTAAFDEADETILLPIYQVAGRDERTPKPGVFDSLALARAAAKRSPKKFIVHLANPRHLKRAILALPGPLSRKVIVMMGAGDIVNQTARLLKNR